MNIKVQMPEKVSTNALIESGLINGGVLTFHAYSDEMKARVLELIAKGENVLVSQTDQAPRKGEWIEPHL